MNALQKPSARAEELESRRLLASLTIAQENALPGTPQSVWDIVGSGSQNIQGFATDISVNRGSTIQFKIDDTGLAKYHIDIYRMGYYQGNGARLVTTIPDTQTLDVDQPNPKSDPSTGLIDCGNWSVTASWAVPADATSGIYFGKVIRENDGGASHIVFIVRNDSSHSDILVQTSDETWQAYNRWGGNSLYVGSPVDRAYKVSYNRPFNTRDATPQDWVFSAEYPMVRFLEANGYDVSYFTGIDAARNGSLILNHKLYMSVGHDEYWSGPQRANVEAAVKAGVNLSFFSGNEVYWKTRWENSIDGSNTAYRTLVCYKESTDDQSPGSPIPNDVIGGYNLNGIADPTSTWTGLWRDTRFSTDTSVEQTLTGQLWSVNRGIADLFGTAIQVPADFGKARIWRNTSVANLAAGQVATLANGTLGYEWDEDVDTAFRPAGTIDLSHTTESVPEKLIDPLSWPGCGGTPGSLCSRCRGCYVAAGTATHSLTEHRDPTSNALIFDVGTIQWSWGLDSHHDGGATVADARMQQATVNILADQGVQPATLIAGLVPATQSTDKTGPASAVTIPQNSTVSLVDGFATITGTSTDTGGGIVAGVEVSTDGGATWHPATTGRANWSYTWSPTQAGATNIRVRGTDDSANIGAVASATLNVVQTNAAQTIWSPSTVPGTQNDDDTGPIEVGVRFQSDVAGFITAIRFYKGNLNTGTHIAHLWTNTGTLLATATFVNESASGWQTVQLTSPVAIAANTTYVASYHTDIGHYASDDGFFTVASADHNTLHALPNGVNGMNGVYIYGASAFPNNTYLEANYWVDVEVSTNNVDTTPPAVISESPAAGATNVVTTSPISAVFSESIQLSTASFTLQQAGISVAATVSYDDSTHTIKLTSTAALATGTIYTATLSGAKDQAGNPMQAAVSWSFTTSASVANATSIWPSTAVPSTPWVNDPTSVELGVKFTSDVAGSIIGIRFYKAAQNSGTHTGSLWNSAGTLLATATFTNESVSGWQTVTFSSPVSIAANTTYIASYHSSTGYAGDNNYFASSGIDNAPLHALPNSVNGGNGVYTYSSASAFPNETYLASNYWVDVQFSAGTVDTTPPAVTSETPASNATNVATNSIVSAIFSESIQSGTLSFVLKDSSNTTVAATVSYNDATHTATLTPTAALTAGATYTATISGAKDQAGNAMTSPVTWSFITATADTTPPTITSHSPASSATGVARTATVTAIFSESIQPATLSFVLRNSNNVVVASTVSYVDATKTATLKPTAQLAANATYNVTVSGGKDLAGNTMAAVTWSFSTVDTIAPTITTHSPASNATNVSRAVKPTVTYSEAMTASTITATTVQLLKGSTAIAAAVSYDANAHIVTIAPSALLAANTKYTVSVKGGSSGVKDLAGNALASTQTWTFTTGTATTPSLAIAPAQTIPDQMKPADVIQSIDDLLN